MKAEEYLNKLTDQIRCAKARAGDRRRDAGTY